MQVLQYVEESARLCQPETLHICDGSERENDLITYMLQKDNMLRRLAKYDNWWVPRALLSAAALIGDIEKWPQSGF